MSRLGIVAFSLTLSAAWPADFRSGAAAVKITPPPGAPMAGYYYNRAAEGVHDELWAKAIVIESGGARAALVACDLSQVSRAVVEKAKEQIQKETGLPSERVMISGTHTHTGPVLAGSQSRYNFQGEMREIAERYVAGLPARIAESVRLASAALRPARIAAGAGREESLAFNRRFFMKDGSVGWNPGKRNPNIVRPAGPIDPEVGVVYIESANAEPLATYVNYALHLDTVGGQMFSADYPYTLAATLGKVKGAGMLTMFTIGCAGNVNHIDVSSAVPQKGHEEAARIGTVLAAEVLKTYTRLSLVEGAIKARSEILGLPLPEARPDELPWARGIAAKFGEPKAAPFLDQVKAFKVIDVIAREGKPLEAEVQVIAIGKQLAWVGLPGEIFVELGQAIKKASPFPRTIVVELANGNIGYVPNEKAYHEGNYEVVSARCAAGSGEMLAAAALSRLKEFFQ